MRAYVWFFSFFCMSPFWSPFLLCLFLRLVETATNNLNIAHVSFVYLLEVILLQAHCVVWQSRCRCFIFLSVGRPLFPDDILSKIVYSPIFYLLTMLSKFDGRAASLTVHAPFKFFHFWSDTSIGQVLNLHPPRPLLHVRLQATIYGGVPIYILLARCDSLFCTHNVWSFRHRHCSVVT